MGQFPTFRLALNILLSTQNKLFLPVHLKFLELELFMVRKSVAIIPHPGNRVVITKNVVNECVTIIHKENVMNECVVFIHKGKYD